MTRTSASTRRAARRSIGSRRGSSVKVEHIASLAARVTLALIGDVTWSSSVSTRVDLWSQRQASVRAGDTGRARARPGHAVVTRVPGDRDGDARALGASRW